MPTDKTTVASFAPPDDSATEILDLQLLLGRADLQGGDAEGARPDALSRLSGRTGAEGKPARLMRHAPHVRHRVRRAKVHIDV